MLEIAGVILVPKLHLGTAARRSSKLGFDPSAFPSATWERGSAPVGGTRFRASDFLVLARRKKKWAARKGAPPLNGHYLLGPARDQPAEFLQLARERFRSCVNPIAASP